MKVSHANKRREGESQRKLEHEIDQLTHLVDYSSDAIILRGLDRRIISWNRGAEALFGYSKAEAVGKNSRELGVFEYTEAGMEEIERELRRKGTFSAEKKYRHRDGALIYGSVTVNIVKDHRGQVSAMVVIIRDITAQKMLAETLKRQNKELEERVKTATRQLYRISQRFRAMIEHNNDIIVLVDADRQIFYRSPSAARITGWTNEAVTDIDTLQDVFHPDDRQRIMLYLNEAMNKPGKPISTEFRVLNKAGDCILLEGTAVNLLNDENINALVFNARDITEKRKAEEAIRQSEEKYRSLVERLSDGFIALDTGWNFTYANKAAEVMFERPASYLAGKNIWEEFPLVVNGPFYKAYHTAMELQRHVCLDGYSFSTHRWIQANVYPSPTGLSIYFRDITVQKKAEDKALQSEQQYKDLVERITDSFFSLDREWHFTYMNKQMSILMQRDPAGMLGRNMWEVFPDAVGSDTYQAYHKAMEEQCYVSHTGYYAPLDLWHENHIYPSKNGLSVFVRDITGRMKAELATRHSEETRKKIMASALDAIICMDMTGTITVWNSQAEQLFGWQEEEAIGKQLADTIMPAQYAERHREGFRRYKETGEGRVLNKLIEVEAINSKGEEFPIELFIVEVNEKETSFFCAFIRDITKRKKTEAEMLQTQMRFKQAQAIAHMGNWELNFAKRTSKWSDEAYRIYGVEPGNHNFLHEDWLMFIHPDDREAVQKDTDAGSIMFDGSSLYHRIVRPNGEIRHVYSESKYELDSQGKPTGLYGIVHDITEITRLQQELQEQQRQEQLKLTAAVLETQEEERNAIGIELHDNVNQILTGTKLMLASIMNSPGETTELLNFSIANIQNAINENRKIAHELVAPDFGVHSLVDQLHNLAKNMLKPSLVCAHIDAARFEEELLNDEKKLAVYRIAQEQCTNIIKYAKAKTVHISLVAGNDVFTMTITDDGKGMEAGKQTEGIGMRNIKSRLSVFNGSTRIYTAPGKGFVLKIMMPLAP